VKNRHFTHNGRTASYNSAVATIVERVESWYGKHLDYLKTQWAALTIRSQEPADPVHGKVEIRAESSTVTASVTFWNKGDVAVIRLDLPQTRDSVMDDRKLSPSEDIGLLLDSYFRALASPAG
jgi:hypothetical protein